MDGRPYSTHHDSLHANDVAGGSIKYRFEFDRNATESHTGSEHNKAAFGWRTGKHMIPFLISSQGWGIHFASDPGTRGSSNFFDVKRGECGSSHTTPRT